MADAPQDPHGEAEMHPRPEAPVTRPPPDGAVAPAPVAGDGAAAAPAGGFGLPVAIALIMGSIIGVGIFNLPTSLAGIGPITLASMALTTVGAIALALMFAALSRRLPADGGPYAYARVAFGNAIGFFNAWSYWQIKWRIADRRAMHGQRFARDMTVAVLALVFSILFIVYSRNTGYSWFVYWAPFLLAGVALLLGIPVFFTQRGKMTEPEALPEYR